MTERGWVRSIPNTCGELEREARSRRFNAIEAFAVMTFCLVILWYVQYPFGVLKGNKEIESLSSVMLFLGAMYLLFVSPFLHKDTLSSWGLGNPVALVRLIRESRDAKGFAIALAVIALIGGLAYTFCANWGEASKFLFRMDRASSEAFVATPGGRVAVVLLGLVLATFFSTCVIRYDNFLTALFTTIKVLLVLGTALYATAFLVMGTAAFADFDPPKFALDVFGYIFWGALQQLLFSSYFGTRLRKGFAPAKTPANVWKVRLAVSMLNGAFFGIIHINSWFLAGVCWLLGCFLSWVFMQDRNRNLIALGFIHGFLGSSVGWLFAREKAGGFRMNMGVGPTHMQGFDLLTMVVVTALILAFCAVIVRAWYSWREE